MTKREFLIILDAQIKALNAVNQIFLFSRDMKADIFKSNSYFYDLHKEGNRYSLNFVDNSASYPYERRYTHKTYSGLSAELSAYIQSRITDLARLINPRD